MLFLIANLSEALYETPYYWMIKDKNYKDKADKNRGAFLEKFSAERLKLVFGENRVFLSVNIMHSKDKLGEIDVLVIFGDRAIILEAKTKKLRLESRGGNDAFIQEDFKKSVQDAYDQALSCANLLIEYKYKLIGSDHKEISIIEKFKEIYIFCITDSYSSINFQANQYLKIIEPNPIIKYPLVMEIFTLDVITEILQSPLDLLDYLNKRVRNAEKIIAHYEHNILAYYLNQDLPLIIEDKPGLSLLNYSCGDLDTFMEMRRNGFSKEFLPKEIFNKYKNTGIRNLIYKIERLDDPPILPNDLKIFTNFKKKIGRNEQCPCRSGFKFKKCCLNI